MITRATINKAYKNWNEENADTDVWNIFDTIRLWAKQQEDIELQDRLDINEYKGDIYPFIEKFFIEGKFAYTNKNKCYGE